MKVEQSSESDEMEEVDVGEGATGVEGFRTDFFTEVWIAP